MAMRSVSPPGRYPDVRSRNRDDDFDLPLKKKMNRPTDRYATDPSPSHLSRPIHHRPESSRLHGVDEGNHHGPLMHSSSRDMPLGLHSDRPGSMHFPTPLNDHVGYLPGSPEKLKRQDHPTPFMGDKRYGPTTLDQRFGSDSNRDLEPRICYSRSDLEKITIDIRPLARKPSPTVRRIVNPDLVRLVRRPTEGKKPIFDRQEIKQATTDMREDAHFEHRSLSSLVTSNINQQGMTRRELENYEITRHKFDSFRGPPASHEMRTLNDRWQKVDGKKVEPSYFDRDERTQNYPEKLGHSSYNEEERRPAAPPYDRAREYLDNKFSQGNAPAYPREELSNRRSSLPRNPPDLRHNLLERRKDEVPSSRDHVLSIRDGDRQSQWHAVKSVPDSPPDKMRGKRGRGSRALSLPRWNYEPERSRESARESKPSSFPPRSDRFKYESSYSERLNEPPTRSSPLFQPAERYISPPESSRFRGTGRPSSRVFRSRPFRGAIRGMRGRSSFRSSGGSRGPGFGSRGFK